jgi:hypothetical protein
MVGEAVDEHGGTGCVREDRGPNEVLPRIPAVFSPMRMCNIRNLAHGLRCALTQEHLSPVPNQIRLMLRL